jgi:hypothetical protein
MFEDGVKFTTNFLKIFSKIFSIFPVCFKKNWWKIFIQKKNQGKTLSLLSNKSKEKISFKKRD